MRFEPLDSSDLPSFYYPELNESPKCLDYEDNEEARSWEIFYNDAKKLSSQEPRK